MYSINEPSDSSASATKKSPVPRCAFDPEAIKVPPMAKDGSTPQPWSATVIIEEVVVFPCVPATAMLFEPRMRRASACARVRIGIDRCTAKAISGLCAEIAVE